MAAALFPRTLEILTNLYVEFKVFIHGKYMFKYVLGDPGDDSHSFRIMEAPLPEEKDELRACRGAG